jgi:hypothetical protein
VRYVSPYTYVSILSFGRWNLVIQVDLVEAVSHFLEAARENLTGGMMDQGEDSHKAVNFYCVPLQVSINESLALVQTSLNNSFPLLCIFLFHSFFRTSLLRKEDMM